MGLAQDSYERAERRREYREADEASFNARFADAEHSHERAQNRAIDRIADECGKMPDTLPTPYHGGADPSAGERDGGNKPDSLPDSIAPESARILAGLNQPTSDPGFRIITGSEGVFGGGGVESRHARGNGGNQSAAIPHLLCSPNIKCDSESGDSPASIPLSGASEDQSRNATANGGSSGNEMLSDQFGVAPTSELLARQRTDGATPIQFDGGKIESVAGGLALSVGGRPMSAAIHQDASPKADRETDHATVNQFDGGSGRKIAGNGNPDDCAGRVLPGHPNGPYDESPAVNPFAATSHNIGREPGERCLVAASGSAEVQGAPQCPAKIHTVTGRTSDHFRIVKSQRSRWLNVTDTSHLK